jgi:hypothetical protein
MQIPFSQIKYLSPQDPFYADSLLESKHTKAKNAARSRHKKRTIHLAKKSLHHQHLMKTAEKLAKSGKASPSDEDCRKI